MKDNRTENVKMLFQKVCLSNSVINNFKRKKRACKTALFSKIKETDRDREAGAKWSIWAHTQNIATLPSNWKDTTQDKKRVYKAIIDEGKGVY